MDDIELSRRQILATVGAAGGTGAIAGTGSAALLSDGVAFAESSLASGTVDLRVDWEVTGGDSGTTNGDGSIQIDLGDEVRSGSVSFEVGLPPDGSNNPAYGWLRLACPEMTRLVDALEVDLRYDCGEAKSVVSDGADTLCEVANELREGTLLHPGCRTVEPGAQGCIAPGEPIPLVFEWELDEGFEGQAGTSIEFEFTGWQCRYQDGTTNPYENARPEACDCPRGKDISWVGFCAEDGETLTDTDLDFDVTADTLELYSAPDRLNTIVLQYATYVRVFDDPGTSGEFETDDTDGTVYEQSGNGFDGTDRTNSVPCPDCCGLKYEGPDFDSPESRGCSS